MLQILKEDGGLRKGHKSPLSGPDLTILYRNMQQVRMLDERMVTLQRQGRVAFYGSATGQEAAVLGGVVALEPSDWIVPALREGGAALFRGYPLEHYVGQVFGNSMDPTKGRQMPCHYACCDVHYVSWSSCIGNQLPHAVGIAMAARIQGDPIVVLAYLGDGATSEADFHWAMNFAGAYKAPVVFLCQNNQWAISMSVKQQTASENLAVKAVAYGFDGQQVDGNDVMAVYQATHEVVEKARNGGGPGFIEALTYRMGAHSSSDDPTRYRDESVTELWKKKDPVLRLYRYLVKMDLWDEEREIRLKEEITQEIRETIARVEKATPPDEETLFDDVYCVIPWHIMEQKQEWQSG